ncbi:hypothetical protein KJ815_08065 [bacterium]|nr:hypothetical protein [bacterium]
MFSVHESSSSPTRSGNVALDDRDPCEVPCQPGDMIECPEVPSPFHYVEDCDGGCHRTPPVFFHIEFDWPVCGVGFTYECDGVTPCRDTDWLEFFLPEYATVEMEIEAEFPVLFAIMDYQPCDSFEAIVYAEQENVCLLSVIATPCLPPGSYVAYVAPLYFSGVPVPLTYRTTIHYQPCPPPCAGTIQLDTHELLLSPTYIGSMASASVMVTNAGVENLCIDSVTTTGHVWQASPSSFTLQPGLEQSVQIDFLPTFEHDFEGTIEFFSSDPAKPRDSITVSGTGCHPVVMPLPPILREAASPHDIYYMMPWDLNGRSTEYAIEFSPNGFVTSEYVHLYGHAELEPVWATAREWGKEGFGVITDLEPETAYSVRLHARDCAGAEMVGLPSLLSTAPPLPLDIVPELTILVVNPDTVELNWNPAIQDTAGDPLLNYGFLVYIGSEYGFVDSIVGWTTEGTLRVPVGEIEAGFLHVEPVLAGVHDLPSPFISWPPDGAKVCGLNSILIQDHVHKFQWDSFRVEIDSAGLPALLGSSWDNPWSFAGNDMAVADFDDHDPGPHTLTATVVDLQGRSWVTTSMIEIVPAPFATYQASYDSLRHVFTLDTIAPFVCPGPVAEIYWPLSTGSERYGGSVQFEWKPEWDSMTVVKPFAIPVDKIETTEDDQPINPEDPVVGVVPDPQEPEQPEDQIGWCCVSLTVIPGQPYFHCPKGQGPVKVGLPFKVKVKWKAEKNVGAYSHGQEAKGTRTTTFGECRVPGPTFTPTSGPNVPGVSVKHKRKNGVDYPMDSTQYGDDDYTRARKDEKMRTSIKNLTTEWTDFPRDSVTNKPNGLSVRLQGRSEFKAWARTRCPGTQPSACCKLFNIDWDVVCCRNGDKITTGGSYSMPHMYNVRNCPGE